MKMLRFFLMLCLVAMPAWADTPSAMITSLKGSAMVISGGHETTANPMMSLEPRTLIELRPGTSLSLVFFSRGSHERFEGPALIGIGKNRAHVFEGGEDQRQEVGTGLTSVRSIDPAALRERPSSGGLTAEREGGNTVIRWPSTVPGPYLVSIYKPAQGNSPRLSVWAEKLAGNSVIYNGPVLDSKTTYVAEVKTDKVRIAASLFRVTGGQAEYLGAAQAETEQMTSSHPSDTTPRVLMHTLYSQAGDIDKATASLYPAIDGQPEEDAFVNRLNVMGKEVNRKANADTAYAQGIYAAQDNWTFAPYWDPDRWMWDEWDDF